MTNTYPPIQFPRRITIHFDGSCSMKRKVAAGGAVAYDEEGTELGLRATFLRDVTTPVAEYMALITGLQLARYLGATEVVALGDTELIVRHVDGRYKCKDPKLQILLASVRAHMGVFESCEVREFPKAGPKHKRRYGNARADEIAGQCQQLEQDLSSIPAHIRT